MKNLLVFQPLIQSRGKPVFICTWGLGDYFDMRDVVVPLEHHASSVELLVGYSKKSHDLPELLGRLKTYRGLDWHVRLVPNLHIKAWIIGSDAYVGSCNFVPNDPIINAMWQVPKSEVVPIVQHYWKRSVAVSHSTVLTLVKPCKNRHDQLPGGPSDD